MFHPDAIKKRNISISNFDVFILATSFEEEYTDIFNNKSKSLLKVMNKPILGYQLEFLERNNIRTVYIITNKKCSQSIDAYINNQFQGEIQTLLIATNKELLDVFSLIKSKSKASNFILMTGDSILNFDLYELLDNHMAERNLVTMILSNNSSIKDQHFSFVERGPFEIFGVCPKKGSDNLNRVVYYNKKESSNSKEDISIRTSVLNHASNFSLLYNYENVNFYIFNKNIYSIIDIAFPQREKVNGLKENFIPLLIKKTFNKKINKLLLENSEKNPLYAKSAMLKAMMYNPNAQKKNKDEYIFSISHYSRLLNLVEELQKPYEQINPIFFQTRNNEQNYFMNFSQKIIENVNNGKQYNDGISELESISNDSYIAEPVAAISKGNINHTVIGRNLTLKEGAKIVSSLLLDDVKVGKDCRIKESFIGDNVIIGDNCVLTDCVVASNYNVTNGTNATGKMLSNNQRIINDIF